MRAILEKAQAGGADGMMALAQNVGAPSLAA